MIALLFVLLTLSMVLLLFQRSMPAYLVFGVAMLLNVYWLNFHITNALALNL
ncbi:MAG: DUF5993 family protein [Rhodobacteraceae bacterium]|nr:DUF5993 family protein [Paracoccaceae bacterium]